jgi:predicted ArsR family transcriptional regulator
VGAVTELTDAKRRLLERLKRVESATAPALAAAFGLTDTAVRQHLEALEASGLVERATSAPSGRGRPPVAWRLSELANGLFPDRHAELTVGLLASIREALGEEGLDKVIATRARTQEASYRSLLGDDTGEPLAERVAHLADVRSLEGYLAEAVPGGDGTYLLVEHHCPIADAARSCSGFCQSELELFRKVLGPGVSVERTQHVMGGDQRCAYRIQPVGAGAEGDGAVTGPRAVAVGSGPRRRRASR